MTKYGNLHDTDSVTFEELYCDIKTEEGYDAAIKKTERLEEKYRNKENEMSQLLHDLKRHKDGLHCQYVIKHKVEGYKADYIYSPTLDDAILFRDKYCEYWGLLNGRDGLVFRVEKEEMTWRVYRISNRELIGVHTIMKNPKYINDPDKS